MAEERLREDASLGQRTSLPVEDIIHLLSFCLKTTQFTYNGTYYQQVFGTAMGSPVSAVIANMVMEDVEQRASTWLPLLIDIITLHTRRAHTNVKDCLNSLRIRNIAFSALVTLGIICVTSKSSIAYAWYAGKVT